MPVKQLSVLAGEYGQYPMGLTVTKDKLHVSVVWPGETCSLVIFEKGKDTPWQTIAMDPQEKRGDVWNLTASFGKRLPKNLEYCFELDGNLTPDPFGRRMRGWETWGNPEHVTTLLRSPICREDFDWENDTLPKIPMEDSVIYRVHTRGFTKHSSSGVRDKGTFKGIIDKIPYMKELGVTTVELMPVMEFREVIARRHEGPFAETIATGKINYWGYTTEGYYFAPKASYSSGRNKEPVQELKTLVKELHKAGMELIVELYFQGNKSPAFVFDVVRYWIHEFHLDGVHLVGNAPTALIGQDPYLSQRKIFADSWTGVSTQELVRRGRRGIGNAEIEPDLPVIHLAEYNDGFQHDMRCFLKGDEGVVQRAAERILANGYGTGADKSGIGSGGNGIGHVNYMANTNGFTLMDMVSYNQKHNKPNGEDNRDGGDDNFSWNCGEEGPSRKKAVLELRQKQLRNAMLLLFLSQGTPLLQSGDEFGHTKSGNNNSYCQDNGISWLNWKQLKSNKQIYEFARHAIAFRKAHPMLHMKGKPRMTDYLACGYPDVSCHGTGAWQLEYKGEKWQLGILYCGLYAEKEDGTTDDFIFIMYNMHWSPVEFGMPNLPKGYRWHVAMDTEIKEINGFYEAGKEPLLDNQKGYRMAGRSIAVLLGKKIPETDGHAGKKQNTRKRTKSRASETAKQTEASENAELTMNKLEEKQTDKQGA